MKLQLVAQANRKGQVVIPKTARDKLGIVEGSLLKVVIREQGLYLYPIDSHTSFSKESYLKVLKETRGSWGKATNEESKKEVRRRKLELKATREGKQAW